MNKLPLLLIILMSSFLFSCESNDKTPEIEKINDDYKLLSVTSEGKIFEIGNNSGKTINIGQIKNSANLIMLPTICNVGSKIYAFEATYIPKPNILIIYDKLTGTTTTKQIVFPASLRETMYDPLISNLEYSGSELVAIVSETNANEYQPNKIISINIENYQTTDLGISFSQSSLTSTELINNKLYVSTRVDGLLEIDLINKTIKELQANGSKVSATRLAKINNTKLGLMQLGVPKVVNGVKPFEFSLSNNLLSDKSSNNIYALGNTTGGTISYNNEYLDLVYRMADSKFGILKINYENNSTKFVDLDRTILGSNAIIVDVIK